MSASRVGERLLGASRIALGTIFVVRTTALANLLPIPLAFVRGPFFGWPEAGWPIAWGGLVLPDGVRIAACLVRTLAAMCFAVGFHARIAGVIAGALGLLALQQDPFGFIFTLYTLFVGTIVLSSTDAASQLAIRPDRPVSEASTLPRAASARSSAMLVRVVCGTIYLWAAVAKMHPAWLRGETLLGLAEEGLLTRPIVSVLRAHALLRTSVAWGAVVSELGIGMVLTLDGLVRASRLRFVAIGGALAMHLVFELAARPDVMGWVMASLLLACASSAAAEPAQSTASSE